MAGTESTRSFGHWAPRGSAKSPRARAAEAAAQPPKSSNEQNGAPLPDTTREGLETLANRRQRRDQLIDPVRPAQDPSADEQTRQRLRQLAELRQVEPEVPDLTDGMWERVVDVARPLVTPPRTATPPRSPAPPTNGARRRTPGR